MRQIHLIRKNAKAFDDALQFAHDELAKAGIEDDPDQALETLRTGQGLESIGEEGDAAFSNLEAIILDRLRPPYLINRDEIVIKGEYDRVDLIRDNKAKLEKVAMSVGRVDLRHHRTHDFVGTGWLIDETTAVTNRHVARLFAEEDWAKRFRFAEGRFGKEIRADLNYIRQHDDGGLERHARVTDILYVAGDREPDIAFLRVKKVEGTEPLQFADKPAEPEQPVAAIGYPARDAGRNEPELMARLFGQIYDVKRFSPGLVTDRRMNDILVLADYTSLGGNSGSPVIDLTSGKAVALHYAGVFRESNYAVAADIVAATLAQQSTTVAVPDGAPAEEAPTAPSAFKGRRGYDPHFLGDGALAVPLPGLGPWSDDIAPVSDDDDDILKYHHFSVVQSISRRLPLVTAVNIDGDQAKVLKRKGSWRLDGRLKTEHQIGQELYRGTPLDRGHMVRRRDPGWGKRDLAQAAEVDTFHYTNSVPQHRNLNRKDWVGLEDYVLGAAETKDFKLCVFTGPVFRQEDRRLKTQEDAEDVQIPEEFWKVAVMVNGDTGALSATGYILSHGPMIRGLVEAAFVLGQYETYQVRIAMIEQATGLDFGSLREHDPMGEAFESEAPFGEAVKRIGRPEDLRL